MSKLHYAGESPENPSLVRASAGSVPRPGRIADAVISASASTQSLSAIARVHPSQTSLEASAWASGLAGETAAAYVQDGASPAKWRWESGPGSRACRLRLKAARAPGTLCCFRLAWYPLLQGHGWLPWLSCVGSPVACVIFEWLTLSSGVPSPGGL